MRDIRTIHLLLHIQVNRTTNFTMRQGLCITLLALLFTASVLAKNEVRILTCRGRRKVQSLDCTNQVARRLQPLYIATIKPTTPHHLPSTEPTLCLTLHVFKTAVVLLFASRLDVQHSTFL